MGGTPLPVVEEAPPFIMTTGRGAGADDEDAAAVAAATAAEASSMSEADIGKEKGGPPEEEAPALPEEVEEVDADPSMAEPEEWYLL